jgi:putative ABC transport system permease protein
MISVVSDFRIAVRNLSRNTKRTAVAVLTVAGGVVAYLLAGGFIAFIFQEMREATIHSQLGHVQIVRPGYFEKGIADPYAFLLPSEDTRAKAIDEAIRPLTLTPRLAFSGLVSLGEVTMPFVGEGIDPVKEVPISSRIVMVTGQGLPQAGDMFVLLGEGLATGLAAKPGDTVVLLATKKNGSPSAAEVTVAGIFATSSKDYDDYALRVPVAVARRLLQVDGATSWVALLGDTGDTQAAVRNLRNILPAKDFEVVPWTDLADFYNKTVVLFSKQIGVVKFIIGLIIVLTIMNTQTMNVLERTTEIGTSLAIGLRRNLVMRAFLIEGAIIGVLGGIVGVVLGDVLALIVSAIGIPMPPPPGMAHGYIGKILVTADLLVDSLVLAVVTTVLASVIPAWKASRMNIVDALRYSQ